MFLIHHLPNIVPLTCFQYQPLKVWRSKSIFSRTRIHSFKSSWNSCSRLSHCNGCCQLCHQKAWPAAAHLFINLEEVGQQMRGNSHGVVHCWNCLVQWLINALPIEDSHGEQTTKNKIADPVLVLKTELFGGPDHKSPQSIIIIQLIHLVILPMMRIKCWFLSQDLPMKHPITNLWRTSG